jgi:hypothetical protein
MSRKKGVESNAQVPRRPGQPLRGRHTLAVGHRRGCVTEDGADRPAGGAEEREDTPGFDQEVLMLHLRQAFGGSAGERRAVARAATDLAGSGRYARDKEGDLSPEAVLEALADAPEGGPADRWNWWMGALEVAHEGYAEFQVRRWREDGDTA